MAKQERDAVGLQSLMLRYRAAMSYCPLRWQLVTSNGMRLRSWMCSLMGTRGRYRRSTARPGAAPRLRPPSQGCWVKRRSRWRCGIPLLLVAMPGVAVDAAAAELVVRDLRVDVEWLPTDFDYTLTDSLGSAEGSDSFDIALGLHVGAMYSFAEAGDRGGWLLGGELSLGQYEFAGSGTYETYGVRAMGGYAWQLSDEWFLLSEGYVGYGFADMAFPETQAFNAFNADGTTLDYGGRLGVGWHASERVLLSLTLGYGISDIELSNSSRNLDLELEQSGVSAMFGITYRFSDLPAPLE